MQQVSAFIIPVDRNDDLEHTIISDYRDIQRVVDGTFDAVRCWAEDPDGDDVEFTMWVNDEGLVHRLPHNPRASFWSGQPLRGVALVTGGPDAFGETRDVPPFLHNYITIQNNNFLSLTNRVLGTASKENTDED
jgi:hypothetical protein